MFDFLKTVGQGALYLILSPFILLGVALYSVYAIFLFLFMFIKRIVLFFKGEDMKGEIRFDAVARMHLQNQEEELEKKNEEINVPSEPTPSVIKEQNTTIIQPSLIIQTDEEGRLKGVQMLGPNGQITNQPQIQKQEPPLIEEEPKEEEK